MRILILSCNTGEGHNSCAKALKEVFDSKGHYCVMEDALLFISRSTSKLLSKGHTIIYRHVPGLFRWGYRYSENHVKIFQKGSFLYNYLCSGKERLGRYIEAGDFDAVICTHVFAGLMLTEAKKYCRKEFGTAFVGTDYTCSPSTEASDLDVYFIPDESLREEYVRCGLPESKLVSSGIPVRQMFYEGMDRASAKRAEGICEGHTHLLVMCGSMGCGPIDLLVRQLAKALGENEQMTVVCGTNKRMKKRLERRYADHANVHIRGYVDHVSGLMDSADLYLTKPGGISITEAGTKRLPMVFVDAVAGCEEHNCRFFVDRDTAVSGGSIAELSDGVLALMRDAGKRTRMAEGFTQMEQKNASEYICDYLTNSVLCRHRRLEWERSRNEDKIKTV